MRYYKRLKLCYIEAAAITLAVCAFLFPTIQLFQHTGNNFYTIKLNGTEVGRLGSTENLDTLLMTARRQAVVESGSDELVLWTRSLRRQGRKGSGLR